MPCCLNHHAFRPVRNIENDDKNRDTQCEILLTFLLMFSWRTLLQLQNRVIVPKTHNEGALTKDVLCCSICEGIIMNINECIDIPCDLNPFNRFRGRGLFILTPK